MQEMQVTQSNEVVKEGVSQLLVSAGAGSRMHCPMSRLAPTMGARFSRAM
jgi:hypothetical protein